MSETDARLPSGFPTPLSPRGIFSRRRTFSIPELLAGLVVLLVVWFAGKILLIAFGGLLIAVFLNSLAHGFSRLSGLPYGWSLGLVVTLILAITATIVWLVGSWMVLQANEFAQA